MVTRRVKLKTFQKPPTPQHRFSWGARTGTCIYCQVKTCVRHLPGGGARQLYGPSQVARVPKCAKKT